MKPVRSAFQLSPRNHRSFRTETGLTLIPPAAVARDLSGSSLRGALVSTLDSSLAALRAAWPAANDPEPQTVSWASRRLLGTRARLLLVVRSRHLANTPPGARSSR